MINDGAIIGINVTIGKNVTIGYGAIIGDDVTIKKNTKIDEYVLVGRKSKIGSNTHLFPFVVIDPKCTIGNNVAIYTYSNIAKGYKVGHRVYIGTRVTTTNVRQISHGRDFPLLKRGSMIRWGARIGAHVVILAGADVGSECLIGAGSVVTKSTKPKWIYYGNPARPIKPVPEDELYSK